MKDNEDEEVKEDESTIRKIVSRLSFIRGDLEEIGKINIRTPEVKKIIDEIKDKTEELMDIFFPKRKGGEE